MLIDCDEWGRESVGHVRFLTWILGGASYYWAGIFLGTDLAFSEPFWALGACDHIWGAKPAIIPVLVGERAGQDGAEYHGLFGIATNWLSIMWYVGAY